MSLQTDSMAAVSVAPTAQLNNIYTDVNALSNLKIEAREDQNKALPEVARQFESIFISMAIKSMRQASMGDSLVKSASIDTFRDMHDKQMSIELSKGKGIGLAESIVRQLSDNTMTAEEIEEINAQNGLTQPIATHFPNFYLNQSDSGKSLPEKVNSQLNKNENIAKVIQQINNQQAEIANNSQTLDSVEDRNLNFESPRDFVNQLWPLAEKSAQKLGVKPEVLLSQAALETGWGKSIIKDSKGSSFNLFNIKADQRWQGDKVAKVSLEYEKGTPVNRSSYFRSYDNLQQSFDDYVKFIQNNPR